MTLKRKIRQIGNSLAIAIPNEVFDFLGLDPASVKYKLGQDETGSVFVLILGKDVMAIDEKKFHKQGNVYTIIIPKTLCVMWNIGLDEGKNRELQISFYDSPLKWKLAPY